MAGLSGLVPAMVVTETFVTPNFPGGGDCGDLVLGVDRISGGGGGSEVDVGEVSPGDPRRGAALERAGDGAQRGHRRAGLNLGVEGELVARRRLVEAVGPALVDRRDQIAIMPLGPVFAKPIFEGRETLRATVSPALIGSAVENVCRPRSRETATALAPTTE